MDVTSDNQEDINTQEGVVEAAAEDQAPVEGERALPEATPAEPVEFNWEYKVKDEVMEVPEDQRWFQDDPEKAKQLVDLHRRSAGIEWHQKNAETLKEQLGGYQEQLSKYEPVINQVQQLQQLFDNKEYYKVAQTLGFGREEILELAKQQLALDDMDPEQKRLHEDRQRLTQENDQFQQQTVNYQQQVAQAQADLTAIQLDTELGKPEVQAVASVYDQAHGAGKFRELVLEQGDLAVQRAGGQHIPPSELIPLVVDKFKPFLNGAGAQQPPQESSPQQAAPNKPRVIPNVKGSGGSVGRTSLKSIDDLRKLRQEKFGG